MRLIRTVDRLFFTITQKCNSMDEMVENGIIAMASHEVAWLKIVTGMELGLFMIFWKSYFEILLGK